MVTELHSRTPLDIVDFPEWGGEGYIFLLNQTEWESDSDGDSPSWADSYVRTHHGMARYGF